MRVVALPKAFYRAVDKRPIEPSPRQRSACGTGTVGATSEASVSQRPRQPRSWISLALPSSAWISRIEPRAPAAWRP